MDSGLQQAKLAVSMAQQNVDDTVLKAAESGVVARRNAEAGSIAIPGNPVVTLVRTSTVFATVPVPETQVASVSRGQAATVTVGALGRTLSGRVQEIGVVANPLTRTYDVRVAVQNPDGALRVGMVVEVSLRQEQPGTAIVVPPEAVHLDEAGKPCVFTVDAAGVVRRRVVDVAGFVGEGTALASGVLAGERVVVSGSPMLADGVTVKVAR